MNRIRANPCFRYPHIESEPHLNVIRYGAIWMQESARFSPGGNCRKQQVGRVCRKRAWLHPVEVRASIITCRLRLRAHYHNSRKNCTAPDSRLVLNRITAAIRRKIPLIINGCVSKYCVLSFSRLIRFALAGAGLSIICQIGLLN